MSLRRSRLAFVIHDLGVHGGQERCTYELVKRLRHRWPVDVFAFTFDAPWQRLEGVRFLRIGPHVARPALLKSSIFYAATLPRLIAAARRDGALVHAAGGCSLLADVVQVHFVHAAWRALVVPTLNASRKPLDRAYHGFLDGYDQLFEARAFRRAERLIAVSARVARDLEQFYGIRERVSIVHHGIDANDFSPATSGDQLLERTRVRTELGFRHDQVVIIFVGLYERKHLDTLIRAVARLPTALRDRAGVLAVGAGNQPRFERLARELNIAGAVRLLGPQRAMLPYYRAADLSVLPTPYDTFGMVVLEALACGLPTLVSRDAGAAELLRIPDASTGGPVPGDILNDSRDDGELAAKLTRWLENSELRRAASVSARQLAEQRSWDVAAEEYATALAPQMT
jgi:glycosyltransferase involved in cell wall biosynthesis